MSASMARTPRHQTKTQFSTTGNHPSNRSKIEWTYNKIIPGRKGVAFLWAEGRCFDREPARSTQKPWPSIPASTTPRAFINTSHFIKVTVLTPFLSCMYRVRCTSCFNALYKLWLGATEPGVFRNYLVKTLKLLYLTLCAPVRFNHKTGNWDILCLVLHCYT